MKTLQLKISKIKVIYLMLIAFAITVTSCQKQTNKPVQDCPSDPDAAEKVRKQIVTNGDVFRMFHNYDEKEKVVNEYVRRAHGRKEFNDTRTVYFDFKVLKEYLRLVEEVSKKNNVEPQGIKVVFGAEASKGKYPFQTNVLFVPTTENKGEQSAYTTENNKIVFFKDIKPKNSINKMNIQKGSFFSTSLLVQDDGLSLNGGRPIPPPKNNDPDFE